MRKMLQYDALWTRVTECRTTSPQQIKKKKSLLTLTMSNDAVMKKGALWRPVCAVMEPPAPGVKPSELPMSL
mgnify:CR=1 FL=1